MLGNAGPLDEERKILPKSVQINTTFLRIDQLKLILDINPHILSFNDITVTESSRNFGCLELLSNLAKIVTISDPPFESDEAIVYEFKANYKSVTDVLIIKNIGKKGMLYQVLNSSEI